MGVLELLANERLGLLRRQRGIVDEDRVLASLEDLVHAWLLERIADPDLVWVARIALAAGRVASTKAPDPANAAAVMSATVRRRMPMVVVMTVLPYSVSVRRPFGTPDGTGRPGRPHVSRLAARPDKTFLTISVEVRQPKSTSHNARPPAAGALTNYRFVGCAPPRMPNSHSSVHYVP